MTAWERLLQFDRDLFLAVNGIDHPIWNAVFGWGTWLGDGLVLTVLLFALTRLFDRRRFPKNFALIGLGMVLAGLVNGAIKDAVDRPRPLADTAFSPDPIGVPRVAKTFGLAIRDHEFLVQTHDVRRLKVIGPQLRRESFGSGHTAAAFAFAAGMIYAGRRRARWWWLAFGAFVGTSRIVCGVHFPLDVLAGAIVGVTSSIALLRAFEMFHGLASVPKPWPKREHSDDLNVMMVVGEASADVYGARILERLRERVKRVDAWGVGGDRLRAAGFGALADAHDLSIVGFTAVVTSIVTIVRVYARLMGAMRARRPDVLVCIDLPDFNLMLATQARALGVPVVFVISPQFWAWRRGRIPKIAERISRMIVAFPFEKPFYEQVKTPVAYYGHPIMEVLARRFESRDAALAQFGLDPAKKTLVVAPGSRRNEFKYLLAEMFGAAKRVTDALPGWQIAVPLAPKADAAAFRAEAARIGLSIVTTRGDNFDLFSFADFGLVCSGTATLEAALAGLAHVIVYRGHPLNLFLARRLVKIDRIGLPNIILGGAAPTFPELIQGEATADRLAQKALGILRSKDECERLRAACAEVRAKLTGGDVSGAIADDILSVLAEGDAAGTVEPVL